MNLSKLFGKSITPYFTVIFIAFISTLVIWLPFFLKSQSWMGIKIDQPGFSNILANYDGPLYVIPAKTGYDPKLIDIPERGLIISLPLSAGYFAAHLPFYPILIRLFSFLGYLRAMIVVNLLATFILATFFLYFLKKLNITSHPTLLVAVFLFLPRFLVVRSVGAPESIFMLLVLLSIFFFEKNKYLWAGVFGGLSVITKSPGILLFPAFLACIGETYLKNRKINISWFWLFLIPMGLISVFTFYYFRYGDFFAYFHSGDNIHLVFPFSVFNFQKPWVGTAWLEDVIFYFFLYGMSLVYLWKNKLRSLFYFSLVFFIAVLFVQHRDISRYALLLWPFSLIAFDKFFTSKKFLIVFLIFLPAIFLYAWNMILSNIMPISDWSPFL